MLTILSYVDFDIALGDIVHPAILPAVEYIVPSNITFEADIFPSELNVKLPAFI